MRHTLVFGAWRTGTSRSAWSNPILRWVQSPRELWEVCESMTIRDTIGGDSGPEKER